MVTTTQHKYCVERGQSLVEMAIIVPLLLFLFLGLVEVGWALRGYLQVVQTSREAARVVAKAQYVSVADIKAATVISPTDHLWIVDYTRPTTDTFRLGLPELDEEAGLPNAGYQFHFVQIDTGWPCLHGQPCTGNCEQRTNWWNEDDLIMHPSDYPTLTVKYGIPFESRLDFSAIAENLIQQNNEINCLLQQKQGDEYQVSVNNISIVEVYFRQSHLLGLPFISNTYTDPIELYNRTSIRFSDARRDWRN